MLQLRKCNRASMTMCYWVTDEGVDTKALVVAAILIFNPVNRKHQRKSTNKLNLLSRVEHKCTAEMATDWDKA